MTTIRASRARTLSSCCVVVVVVAGACVGRLPALDPEPPGGDAEGEGEGDADAGPAAFGPLDAGPLAYDPTPPPGTALCARDWDTFDPRRVYMLGAVGSTTVIAAADDSSAYAGGFPRLLETPIIRDTDGAAVYASWDSVDGIFAFRADGGGLVEQCRPSVNPVANDVELLAVQCEEDFGYRLDALRLKQGSGGYVYRCAFDWSSWYDEQHLPIAPYERLVVAADADGRLLTLSDTDSSPAVHVRHNGTDTEVTGMPSGAVTRWLRRSARVLGEHFIAVWIPTGVSQPVGAVLVAIERETGALQVVGQYTFAIATELYDVKLDTSLRLYVISNLSGGVNSISRVELDSVGIAPVTIYTDEDNGDGIGFGELITGP